MEQPEIDRTLNLVRAALEAGRIQDAIAALSSLHPADRAEAFSDLTDSDRAAILPSLDIPATADLLEELEDDEAADLAETLPPARLADVLDEMEPDEAADILGDLPPSQAAQALAAMEDPDEVIPLLHHPDESAGGLMTTSFIALRRHTTAAQAIEFIRQLGPDAETPYYLYVVDRNEHLIGVVGLRGLLTAHPDAEAESFMGREVISVATSQDQEEVARTMSRYGLAAIPVINTEGRLEGVITHDDIVEVLEEEATEDVLHLGAIEAGPIIDRPYWSQHLVEVVRSRFFWLLGLFAAETLTGTVLRHYQGELEAVVSLSFFIPLLIGTGGNAGSQTVTTVIRALALKEVRRRDVVHVLLRELTAGTLLGMLLGAVAFGRVLLWGISTNLAVVVAITILMICIWANTVGSLIPILADAVGIDPTVMSAPLISTLVDATGLVIYFSVAAMVLQEL
jgi:magnesium transporter